MRKANPVSTRFHSGEIVVTQAVRSQMPISSQVSKRKVLSLDQWQPHASNSAEDKLSSTLIAQDKELAAIIEELDRISKALNARNVDTETLSNTLQRTVLCAMKQSLLDRELRSLALTDDLTCLYNRRAFLALAGQQLKVATRNGQGLLLFFADVDGLKEINDSYGHGEGDLSLLRTADALEQTFRGSDIVA